MRRPGRIPGRAAQSESAFGGKAPVRVVATNRGASTMGAGDGIVKEVVLHLNRGAFSVI